MKLKFIYVIFAILFVSCGSSEKELLEKERKEMKEELQTDKLVFYKALKIIARSTPITGKTDSTNFKDLKVSTYTGKLSEVENIGILTNWIFSKMLGITNGENLSVKDYLTFLNTFNKLKDELDKTDEDKFPTILENLLKASDESSSKLCKDIKWNSTKEHMVFGVLLQASRSLPNAFTLYEIEKINADQLENNEYKIIAGIEKGMTFSMFDWNYLAEEALSPGIELLENGKIKLEGDFLDMNISGSKLGKNESQLIEYHGLNCLARGYVRTKTGKSKKEKQGIEDYEKFLEDADKLAIENELKWIVGTYVYIKKDESEKAIPYLEKLEKSPNIPEEDRKTASEIKKYLENRDDKAALNFISDKVFMAKILKNYIFRAFKESKTYINLQNSKGGKLFIDMPTNLEKDFENLKEENSGKNLKDKGKEILKKLL